MKGILCISIALLATFVCTVLIVKFISLMPEDLEKTRTEQPDSSYDDDEKWYRA